MASIVPVTGAGSIFKVGDGGDPTETFAEVPQCVGMGKSGAQGEFVQATPISKTTHEYISGMETPPDKQLVFHDVPGDAAQAAFLLQAYNRETVNCEIAYSNGRISAFTLVLAGYEVDEPEGSGPIKVTVYAKQSGAATHTFTP